MNNNIRFKIGVTLFFVLLFSFFYFMRNPWSPNSRTRVALALSMIEDGTVNINKYHHMTVDKAIYKGDYYADKAPGYSFTALPAIWAGYTIFRTVCSDWGFSESGRAFIKTACSNNKLMYSKLPPELARGELKKDDPIGGRVGTHAFDFIQLAGTYFASGLVSALTALILYFFAMRVGSSTEGAVFAALAYGLATPAWVWSTAFHGHVLAGSCLFIAFASLYYLNNLKKPTKLKEIALAALAGALLSWAVVVEYTALIASIAIALYGLSKVRNWESGKRVRTLVAAAAFAGIFILPLLIYNYAAFDSLFSTGYKYVPDVGIFTQMEEGFHGLSYPHFEWFYGILFGGERGLFWFSPILLLSPYAIYRYWYEKDSKSEVILICAVIIYYILWNSSYFYWHGGTSTGPRHLTPIIVFMCLPLALLWSGARKWLRYTLCGLFIASFFITIMAASVRMIGPNLQYNALFDVLIPRFADGKIPQVIFLRTYIGLLEIPRPQMLLTLLPLLAVIVLGVLYIWRLLRQERLSGS